MAAQSNEIPELEFSDKYSEAHARRYYYKHQKGLGRRLTTWRERAMARKALHLAGDPASVLDLPCGTGRFWGVLCEKPDRKIHAADSSGAMLNTGLELRPVELTRRVESFTCSAFDIPKPDNFVECVLGMRFLHHIGERDHRVRMLHEFSRVASDTILVSAWIDGNYKAWRRRVLERKRERQRYQNRFVLNRSSLEKEFNEAGLDLVGRIDFLKYYSMWALYVLKVRR